MPCDPEFIHNGPKEMSLRNTIVCYLIIIHLQIVKANFFFQFHFFYFLEIFSFLASYG